MRTAVVVVGAVLFGCGGTAEENRRSLGLNECLDTDLSVTVEKRPDLLVLNEDDGSRARIQTFRSPAEARTFVNQLVVTGKRYGRRVVLFDRGESEAIRHTVNACRSQLAD